MTKRTICLDSARTEKKKNCFSGFEQNWTNPSFSAGVFPPHTLFSRGARTTRFFTEDSKLYITPREQKMMDAGHKLNRHLRGWDSLSSRVVLNYKVKRNIDFARSFKPDLLLDSFLTYRQKIRDNFQEKSRDFWSQWSMPQLWNFSIIGAVLLGMVSMSLIYKFLGPGASAGNNSREQAVENRIIANIPSVSAMPDVLGATTEKFTLGENEELEEYVVNLLSDLENKKKEDFEAEIRKMVKGYPIEKMIPYITEKDRIVAAFLVGIAKKESGWGVHVPLLNGQDCYNYWGYRGIRKRMGTGGHTCFDSRKDAVDTVAKRLETLIKKNNLNTPSKLVVWKCGSACAKDDQAAVRKWISDVELYFSQLKK